MTTERAGLLALVIINAGAAVVAAGASGAGLPVWVGFFGAVIAAASGAGLAMMHSWGDAAPAPPH